ncbi:MAG: MmcB family DNA repair protein [Sarcina sp.]
MKNLISIENELTNLINLDKKNWTHFYLLLKEIEERELWKETCNSFTAWVKEFSIKTKTHESIIWNRKKAGKVYESYQRVKEQQGYSVKPIGESNVSADSLVILDKINKYDEKIASKLVDKVMNKSITKKDLREVYKSIRPETISRSPKNTLSEEKKKQLLYTKNLENDESNEVITANDIVSTLCGIEWLNENKTTKRIAFKTSFEQNKYKAFTEFPVFTGTSKKSRRMDLLIAENITSKNTWNLNLHCVEIKVSKSDLINDKKYTEYTEFVDYMWLAVPENLIDVAKDHSFKSCGIISMTKEGANIIKQALKIDSLHKKDTLNNLALKIL